ncbi:MAG: hypothetical protein MUE49_06425 [Rhodospirillales bacterium]|nr:hypothetical protein [Rhodospirillales bacterium]
MALSGYSRRRRRGRFGLVALKWLAALAIVGIAAAFVYDFGRRQGAGDVRALAEQVDALGRDRDGIADENRRLTEALNQERQRLTELRQAYDRDVPQGAIRELNALIAERLAAGLSAAELRASVGAAEAALDCAGTLERKRLRVGTDTSATDNGLGSFGDGALTLKVSGLAARNAQGQPEAWFDPGKPVTVQVVRPGGRNERWSGPLPLHPLVRLGGNEYRFTIAADARGLIQVAMQHCRRI